MRGVEGGRVAYVSYDGLLEPLGASQVLPHVVGLAERGFDMGVVSFEKDEDLRDENALGEVRARLSSHGVDWTHFRYHRRPTLPATAYDIAVATRHLRQIRPQVVHARSYVAATMASLGTRKGDGRLLFDMRGFWIDERIEGQGWDPEGLKARQGRRVEQALLARADHVVHLTDAGRAALHGGCGPGPGRHSTIPTCVDLERFSVPADRPSLRVKLGLPPKGPVLIHSGTLGARYQIGRTLDIGRRFAERSGGSFVIVTRDLEGVSRRAAEMGVPAVIRSASPGEMPEWIAAADFGLALVAPGPAGVASAPTKVGEYLASGLGVVATRVGDLAAQLGRARYSRVIGPGAGGDEIVNWLLSQPSAGPREDESRLLAERYYDLSDALDAYEEIYRSLGARPWT